MERSPTVGWFYRHEGRWFVAVSQYGFIPSDRVVAVRKGGEVACWVELGSRVVGRVPFRDGGFFCLYDFVDTADEDYEPRVVVPKNVVTRDNVGLSQDEASRATRAEIRERASAKDRYVGQQPKKKWNR